MQFKSDRQRKAVMANIHKGSSGSPKSGRSPRSISMISSKLPGVKALSLPDFYDVYTIKKKTIIPARGFYDHDKRIIYLNLGSVSKDNLIPVVAHELGHHFFGKSEFYAENFAKSKFGQDLAKKFIKGKKIVIK